MKYFDVHAHIFPEKIAAKVVSALEEYYHFQWQGSGIADDLLASMDEATVSGAVIFSCATRPDQVRPANDFLCAARDKYPGRFLAFGTIHPDLPDLEKELERIKNAGLHGIKLHPDFQKTYINEPAMMRMYEKMDGSLPLIIHAGDPKTDFSSPWRLKQVLRAFPHLTITAAHFGGYGEWDQVWKHLIDEDIFFDTSSSLFKLPSADARAIIKAHGADRILFASDYPATRHRTAIAEVMALKLDESDCEKIFHLNAEKLLGII